MKTCSKCKIEKPETAFHKDKSRKDGLNYICKKCQSERSRNWREKEGKTELNRENARKWAEANRDHKSDYNRQYRETHTENIKKLRDQWNKDHPKYSSHYRNSHLEKCREKDLQRYHKNRLARCMANSIRTAIKAQKAGRKWGELVGYTITDLMQHLEAQFTSEMNWENYGSYWHVDHIKPQSWFDQLDPAQFKICWALENLQPLEAIENIRKGNRWEG
jgi:hypothetical protein